MEAGKRERDGGQVGWYTIAAVNQNELNMEQSLKKILKAFRKINTCPLTHVIVMGKFEPGLS